MFVITNVEGLFTPSSPLVYNTHTHAYLRKK